MEGSNASVPQGLEVMVSKIVKILTNAKRRRLVSALNVAARILGAAMTAVVQYMDSEIRAIMAQYMPLDSQAEVPNHVNDQRA
ncbi:unnamed protein product [Sphenostylis stenocarpa]|uniref:Uncharacterized protein n=1 Tax=Sphenostylis stenocarpa TaxID=92480 RepID=A0AA86VC82_9FABA|nr:unnamed protein product [Sphenostylis stenocarpa]